jgi:hypothetical protein
VKIFSKKVYYKEDISQSRYITTSRGNSKKDILQRRYITKKIYYKEDILQRRYITKKIYYKEDILQRRYITKKIYYILQVGVILRRYISVGT